jgi:hypothetical protein
MKNEIILYRQNELQEHIEVRIEDDTVWLSQEQISMLFERDRSVVTKHIRNIFKEGELEEKSNVQKMHIANSDKPIAFYNLDVIISVGYHVKSKKGTQFRIWATRVLKDYLLKGYAINNRVNRIEDNIRLIWGRNEYWCFFKEKGKTGKAKSYVVKRMNYQSELSLDEGIGIV